ncbi:uncharacterized protein C13orf42 homolog [Rhinatrema bivittatum]|uniref:uncharacterized protein C13orf42 homolog n=1 Tax=Rhinatrema bivittatum TaxID=194408 RepID=UPI001125B96D|nr:uncharacterized protein C13orf42 homolog [Rhinatrema bivittatum]
MLRKIHSIFHPNSQSSNLTDGSSLYDGTNSAVRLVRSTSMYVIGEGLQKSSESLKKYKSTTSIESSGCYRYKEEDRAWMYSKTRDCLQYLQDLLALRKKYLNSLHNLKSMNATSALPPISTNFSKEGKKLLPSSKGPSKGTSEGKDSRPASDIIDAIAYFDTIIADLDAERRLKIPAIDQQNVDVDFDVATSSSEHSLHSNWILRTPRRCSVEASKTANAESQSHRTSNRMMRSQKRIERYPIYLPKAVEGAFNTLKFKPKSCKRENSSGDKI